MKIQLTHTFEYIISLDNLLAAWQEFLCGKRGRADVQYFSRNLLDNILLLHEELANHTYRPGPYQSFFISDPKPRHIHKASVRDRLVHHALYRILYPFFNRTFITDSFSCRLDKGTHKALERFKIFIRQVSQNNTKTCWVLQCDIRKFFASIDHKILLGIVRQCIPDKNIMELLSSIVQSFYTTPGIGLPLGNLTSQLLVNVYMNEFDQFVKHKLKVKYYLRYADDFVILSCDRGYLEVLLREIDKFLRDNLRLLLHPRKIQLRTIVLGIDFLGWVHFPKHRVLRTTTRWRMMRNIDKMAGRPETLQSYLGLLNHGNSFELQQEVLNTAWLLGEKF